jgi:hypothetical protein
MPAAGRPNSAPLASCWRRCGRNGSTPTCSAAEQAVDAAFTAPDPQQGRLRFNALRWYASKLLPKVYGDRIDIEQTTPAVVSDEPMSVDEWFAKYGHLGAQNGPGPERAH